MANSTQPILELVKEILPTIPQPHGEDIIEDVFLAIEHNKAWRERYDGFVVTMKKDVPNNWIGGYVQQTDGRSALRQVGATRSKLIRSYSKLGKK